MRMRINFVAAICLACWLILAGFPVSGYNSLNESAEAALPLNILALESDQVNSSQENLQNYSDVADEMPYNLTNITAPVSSSVDYSNSGTQCQNHLWIVDYWGNHYTCNAKCVLLHDTAKMVIAPCKTGSLKLYEKNPDGNVVESRYIRVPANKRYNWWFIGDTEGLHTLWYTIKDRYGQVSQSNNVTYQVILENCPGIANCSPSSGST